MKLYDWPKESKCPRCGGWFRRLWHHIEACVREARERASCIPPPPNRESR